MPKPSCSTRQRERFVDHSLPFQANGRPIRLATQAWRNCEIEKTATMSRPIEAITYHLTPPPNRSRARPDSRKIFARWQSGLETPSGCKQWKLSLRLFTESTWDEAFPCNRASHRAVVAAGRKVAIQTN